MENSPISGLRSNTVRYGSFSIGIHWLMLILIAAVYACMELKGIFPKGSDSREMMKTWHFMLGLSVLVLAALRLVLNLTSPIPDIRPDPPRWQKLLARLMHLALYALMLGLPLAGWLLLSAAAKPIPFFGLQLPALIGESKTLATLIKEIHETGATVGYFLIGFHAAAALYHHYGVHDDTLLRMMPRRD
ncbi:MAG: cytochrome b [Propionivibrio sp.]|uniref:Cytochrome b n=1 Tax=Candidatus Propionivibrio dominans TaxID=2954373 RepID=A0A9D7F5K1_9RHOO|nr:cytochrome b [Candidatus Propionivibrio dominans]MBL0166295.1 cytochrome b [Propionivibrio sp.]